MTPAQRAEVVVAAQATAKLFVEEFGEPLDGAETDWDATAWDNERPSFADYGTVGAQHRNVKLMEVGWELYGKTLEAETERLCA